MKVVYLGRASRRVNAPPKVEGDVLELLSNNWDDFGFKTSFMTVCRIDKKEVDLGLIRLLVDEVHIASDYLDKLLQQGWEGEFPIPRTKYISVPSEIAFYEQLMGMLTPRQAVRVATQLRDASYLAHVAQDAEALRLVDSKGFRDSLQRERGSQKAFLDGWRILERQATAVLDLGFKFNDVCGNVSTLKLKFQADNPLPHDVNALIGPNGVGKSRVLHQIVKDWMTPSKTDDIGFTKKPNLSQVVVVSYSPFERFSVDLKGEQLQDQDAYRYYGFRGRKPPTRSDPRGRIQLSHAFPKRNAASALIECLSDDQRYSTIKGWAQKVRTMEKVLGSAFDFEFAAVSIQPNRRPRSFYREPDNVTIAAVETVEGNQHKLYIPIASSQIDDLDAKRLRKMVLLEDGVTFFRHNKPLLLSSGQRLFSYVVINILGAIRRNSLILIDEPELFLHPTLEIQFVDMLKKILARFNSKALLATHSEVTVREIPAACVHVFEKTDEGLAIKRPPFQTFGGDVQRISSYVFGDSQASKPFEKWIEGQMEELGSAQELIDALGDQINEELVVQIKAMEQSQW